MIKNLTALIARAEAAEASLPELRAKLAEVVAAKNEVISDISLSESDALKKASELGAQESVLLRRIERAQSDAKGAWIAALNEAQHLAGRVVKLVQEYRAACEQRLEKALTPFYPAPRDLRRAVELLLQRAVPTEIYVARKLGNVAPDRVYEDGGPMSYARHTLAAATRAITTFNLE